MVAKDQNESIIEIEDSNVFFEDIVRIHQIAASHFNAVEEQAFTWLDGILEVAKKAFREEDTCLLPKTPCTVKKPSRKIKKSDMVAPKKMFADSDDSDLEEEEKQNRGKKRTASSNVSMSDDDDFVKSNKVILLEDSEEDLPPVRQKRATRGNSRTAATTSKARNLKKEKKSKANKKTKSIDIIKNLEAEIRKSSPRDSTEMARKSNTRLSTKESFKDGQSENSDKLSTDLTDNRMDASSVVVEEWIQSANTATVALKHKIDSDEDRISAPCPQAPIQNFGQMNVKEKVQAYEDIGHSTPVHESKKRDSNDNRMTPENQVMDTQEVQKTPDTVVVSKTSAIESNTSYEYFEEIVYEELPAIPGMGPTGLPSEKKSTPRISQPRKSVRASLRKSLKMLPSQEKRISMQITQEVDDKPVRTRTRLRLKKKETGCDTDSSQDDQKAGSDAPSSEKMDIDESASSQDEQTETRSTRTKTRQAKNIQTAEYENDKDSANEDMVKSKSGSETSPSETSRRTTRLTMTKSADNNEETVEPRTTRTKTRKRQLDEEAVSSSSNPKRSRSHYNQAMAANDTVKTPTRNSSSFSNDDSSDGDYVSPTCPSNKAVRPHPKSFLNRLKPLATTPLRAASTNPGLVRSFITRNSPAKKPSLKELQLKKKQELMEKDQRQQEIRKKRVEEHKLKIEECRKKREEKMRKVQESREQKEKQERENRLNLEKKMAEKKQLTSKLKEDKIKEEKEKQKIRLQKLQEAEERRKHEEEERIKRLQDQLENEKSQAEFMQRKKEFEEQERQKRLELDKQRAVDRHNDLEKEREKERERLVMIQAAEDEKQKEWIKKKEERERLIAKEKADREKYELLKKKERDLQLKKEMDMLKEQERIRSAEQEKLREEKKKQELELQKIVDKHNTQVQNQQSTLPKPNLNKTHSLNEPTVVSHERKDSYELTPDRVYKPATEENYNIDDIKSEDETDDEEAPRKKIPDWAQGALLKAALIKQHLHPPNLDNIFDVIEPPDLNKMFVKKKARFNKRTSSAHWDTPILKPGLLGRPCY